MYIPKEKRKSKLYLRREYNIFIEYINTLNQYLIYLIKRKKIRVYDANIIIFNESIIKSTIVNLSLDLNFNDLTLIKKSND